ncbi:MAG: hypothetical protein ACJAWQ_000492 [Paraglaciecola sp.]|uniref:DNA-J related domain-containing protein n=1 Tax=uncultured Paraglaciecola sp. TaxID=1765024 RepID=UPI0025F959A0|nr:DNA-J related domain-containing protein [uncultured Paraglaciecola sp.]
MFNELQTLLNDTLATFRPAFELGISEYELICALKSPPYSIFDEDALCDSLMMFQTHFVLFHCLYQLRNRWREQKIGELVIGLTTITLNPTLESSINIETEDSLANYYLDWSNLGCSNKNDIEALLDSFWQKMAGAELNANMSLSELKRVCIVMEIESLADITLLELKQQYRKLQHKNHPDKGGSIIASQSVLQAYSQLHKYISVNS